MSGTLYIVATPIGNLDDLTPRARQTLVDVDLIASEDTRHTGRLLSHIGAKTPQIALHDHNESDLAGTLISRLQAGKNVALVSDAGTPLVSDPGYRVVAAARESGIVVTPIPGASALVAALSVAGLATDRFCFEGFPPAKSAARRQWLERLAHERRTMVFFESVHRIDDCLDDMAQIFGGERMAFIGRELTKLHEQGERGTLASLLQQLRENEIPQKGEFVVAVAGAAAELATPDDTDRLLTELAAVLPAKQAAAITAKFTGQKKNALYARLLELTR